MPHASIIVPSVIGAAAAAAAFEVTVFKPWRERNAPHGLHVLIGEELSKFGRTAEAFASHVGQQADQFGERVRDELRRVGEDAQHAAGELRHGIIELTQGGSGNRGEPSAGRDAQGHEEGRGSHDERRSLMRPGSQAGAWEDEATTSALDDRRAFYPPAETDYDPDDDNTLASLQQQQQRRRVVGNDGKRTRDDEDNITLRDLTSAQGRSALFDHDDGEDEGTAAFRAHRSLIGQAGMGPSSNSTRQDQPGAHSTIFDMDDFAPARRSILGLEDVQSPYHAVGSPSVAPSELDAEELFFSTASPGTGLKALPLATSSLHGADGQEGGPRMSAAPSESGKSASEWSHAEVESALSDGELVNAATGSGVEGLALSSRSGSAAASATGSLFASDGWVELEPSSSPESTSPRSVVRQLEH